MIYDRFSRNETRPDIALLAQTEKYWRSLIGPRQVPLRSDVDPMFLGDALGQTMVLERVASGVARIRLAGQAINGFLGHDPRGMPLSVLVEPASRTELGTQIEAMFNGPAIVEIPLQIGRNWGRNPVPARLLMLPLTDGHGQINRALAVLTSPAELPKRAAQKLSIPENGAFRCTLMPKRPLRPVTPTHPARRSGDMSQRTRNNTGPYPLPKDDQQEPALTHPPQSPPHLTLVVSNS